MEDTEICPYCSTCKKDKPSMRMMINACAHIMCDTCVDKYFAKGTASCPKCTKLLKKNDFRELVFEDTYIEKEVALRKKYLKDLVRQENEFPSLREFNDYLETVETIIFNLANNIDEEKCIKKLEELRKEAKESSQNKSRLINEVRKDNPQFTYKPIIMINHGPQLSKDQELLNRYSMNLQSNPVQLASGFPSHVPVRRLLSDSFADLYYCVKESA